MNLRSFLFLALLGAVAPVSAHQHIAAGFSDTNTNGQPDPGEPLRFVNPPAANAVFRLLERSSGNYAGFFSLDEFPRTQFPNDYFTFTALSDGQVEAADPRHAATGSYLWVEIRSVTGPAGGNFGFWDAGRSYEASTPTISFAANEPTGNFRFELSEPLVPGDPGEDPWGHIHDRGWTATLAGVYEVTFRLVDISTNGPGGTPRHSPSPDYKFTFVAGENTPTPTPSATPPPAPAIVAKPTLKISGAKKRTVSGGSAVLRGQAEAAGGLQGIQMKSARGGFRMVARSGRWTITVRGLKPGANRLSLRAIDAGGQVSPIQTLVIRRR